MSVPFNELNSKQQQIVRYPVGKLLVLAGPGTGKTEVLTHRIAYLITHENIHTNEILAITFSKKATNEMSTRLMNFDGLEEEQPRVSTLHAEALRILSRIDVSRNFIIADNYESLLLLKDASEDLQRNLGIKELRKVIDWIRIQKANNKLPEDIVDEDLQVDKEIYERYEELLTFNCAIDLDGLALKVVRALHRNGLLPSSYSSQVKHLLVDEYQDINQVEFKLIQFLAKDADSFFVVGDDDQSIYGWRGADPTIIREFEDTFQGSQVETLIESIRCPEHILKGAQAIISRDQTTRQKTIQAGRGEGAPIHVLYSSSEIREACWIANWIEERVSAGNIEPRDIAMLCNNLKLADDVISQLRRRGIKVTYWKSGGIFKDKNIRDILAHIRIIIDRNDNLALRRCLESRTGRGIGNEGVRKLRSIAEKNGHSLWYVLTHANDHLELKYWRSRSLFERFVTTIDELHSESTRLELDEVIDQIARKLGIPTLDSVDILKTFARSLPANTNLQNFLKEVNKNRGLDLAGGGAEPEKNENTVAVMSIHSAKGLTFDVIFLLGCDEGILPNPNQDINEQRRLCYVAMTRARKDLFLCHAKRRTVHGLEFPSPSNFIIEIPGEHKEEIENF